MIKTKQIFSIIPYILFVSMNVFGQSAENYFNNISLPSPSAYEMTRYDAQQPNLYTGTASVNIPLYSINFDGWQIPLSLSYHASGIKVNQEATEVGLGWSLNSTAVITRTIKSGDDLINYGFSRTGYVFENKDYYNIFKDWWLLSEQDRIFYQERLTNFDIDGEPDMFNYNFFGYTGSFVFQKLTDNGKVPIQKLTVDAVKIEFIEGDYSFTITTPEGFVGFFRTKEYTTGLSGSSNFSMPESKEFYSTTQSAGAVDVLQIKNNGNFRTISSWYLDYIQSPSGKRIDFTYDVESNNFSNYVSIGMPSFSENNRYSVGGGLNGFSRQIVEHIYQKSIVINNEIEILFSMDNRKDLGRLDINSITPEFPQTSFFYPKKYNKIVINSLEPNSSVQKEIRLKNSYFNEDVLRSSTKPYEHYQKLRLRLDGIEIEDQIYEFNYYKGKKGLPDKSSFGLDHQGFYNGNDFLTTINPVQLAFPFSILNISSQIFNPSRKYYYSLEEREPKLEYSIAGALESVRYPTMGKTLYKYSLHDFYTEGINGINNSTPISYIAPAIQEQNVSNGSGGNYTYGGMRIQTIESYDSRNLLVFKKTFDFNKADVSKSSGVLINPVYYIANVSDPDEDEIPDWYFVHKSTNIPGKNTAHGSDLGYSRVVENIWSINGQFYSEEHYFENNPTKLIGERLYFKSYTQNHINGKLKTKSSYNNNGNLKSTYQVNAFDLRELDSLDAVGYTVFDAGGPDNFYVLNLYTIPKIVAEPKQITSTTFFQQGSVISNENYTYDNLAQLQSSEKTNSKNELLHSYTKRINDYTISNGPIVNGKNMRTWLLDNNFVTQPLEQINYLDNKVISAIGFEYGVEYGMVLLKAVYRYNRSNGEHIGSIDGFTFNGGYERIITYDKYNEKGKLLQQTIENGKTVSYIWNEKNTYPIIKAENIKYDDLYSVYSSITSSGSTFETELRNDELTKNALITSYLGDPLLGLKEIVEPNEILKQYEYDENERLSAVKDKDDNLITDYEYYFSSFTKSGGLEVVSNFNFGQTPPGTNNTKDITITNTGNYGITINNIATSGLFSVKYWPPSTTVYLPPNQSYTIPVTFSAPSSGGSENTGVLTINSNGLNNILTVNLSGLSQNFSPSLNIPEKCIVFQKNTNPLNTLQLIDKYVRFENLGNGPLKFNEIISTDSHLKVTGYEAKKRYDTNGNPYFEPYEIPANSYIIVKVKLVSNDYGEGSNWDGTGSVYFTGLNDTNTYDNGIVDFYWNTTSQCASPPPTGPAFTISGSIQADCSGGMSGSITVNYGSVQFYNQSNQISGPNYVGPTITINGVGDLNSGSSVNLIPTTYPKIYNFSSTSSNCNNGFGNSKLLVTPN